MNKVVLFLLVTILVMGCVQQGQQTQQPQQGEQQPVQPPAGQPGVKEFSMVIGHTFYNPATITANKGDTVVIKAVAASGTTSHNHGITIDEYGINQAVTTEDSNNPVIVEFVADKEGTFSIYCKTCWDGPFGQGHPDIRATLQVNP